MEKDMNRVLDYERRKQLAIFKGQCFNNACVLLSNQVMPVEGIFDLAQVLYNAGLKRGWV